MATSVALIIPGVDCPYIFWDRLNNGEGRGHAERLPDGRVPRPAPPPSLSSCTATMTGL